MLTEEMGFKNCIHEPCLYYKFDDNDDVTLILRQVDDFLVANKDAEECDKLGDLIQSKMTFPLNTLGLIRKFNGVDIEQTRNYNKVHCATYINKIVSHHEWQNKRMRRNSILMRADNKHQKEFQEAVGPSDPKEQKALQQKKEFNYRQAIGELIYGHTICRINISIAIITHSQFVQQPAEIHYDAVKHLFSYPNSTKHYGLIYWREEPRMNLPLHPDPKLISPPSALAKFDDFWDSRQLTGSCDSTWASDRFERRSMGGVILRLQELQYIIKHDCNQR